MPVINDAKHATSIHVLGKRNHMQTSAFKRAPPLHIDLRKTASLSFQEVYERYV